MTVDTDRLLVTREDFIAAAADAASRAAQRPPVGPSDAELEQRERRHRAEEHAAWMATWTDHIPARFVDAHVDQLDGDLAAVAADWDRQRNVLLLGSVGTGKTHAAVAMARTAFETGMTVMFRPSVQLLDELRPGGRDGALDEACETDVLILDDLAAERPTDWTAERLSLIVNERWMQRRPTIATSNLPAAQLEEATGRRMFSRLWHDATAIEVAGTDRRRGVA